MGFPRQEYWSGLPFPSPGDLPGPGIKPGSPALAGPKNTDARCFHPGSWCLLMLDCVWESLTSWWALQAIVLWCSVRASSYFWSIIIGWRILQTLGDQVQILIFCSWKNASCSHLLPSITDFVVSSLLALGSWPTSTTCHFFWLHPSLVFPFSYCPQLFFARTFVLSAQLLLVNSFRSVKMFCIYVPVIDNICCWWIWTWCCIKYYEKPKYRHDSCPTIEKICNLNYNRRQIIKLYFNPLIPQKLNELNMFEACWGHWMHSGK